MATVLIVDDEFGNAEVLSLLLTAEGFTVVSAAHGRDALERLAQRQIDLVITDFMMPVMDGGALVAELRRQERHAGIPVIVTSAVDEATISARMQGHDAFLRKPFDAEALILLVRRLLAAKSPDAAPGADAPGRADDQVRDFLRSMLPKPRD